MRETVNKMWANLREYVSKMSKANRIRMAILAGGILVLAIVTVALLSRTKWVVLPVDPLLSEQVVSVLGANNIQVRREDSDILIPEPSYNAAQTVLWEEGFVGPPGFNDTYLNAADGFAVSSQQAGKLYDAYTADRLETMIEQSPKIRNAMVLVNSGESSPFKIQTNTRKPTASVSLTLAGNEPLSMFEATAILELVQDAVPGLETEDITILDNYLNNYTGVDERENFNNDFEQRLEWQNRLAATAKAQAENLFFPIYGMDNIQVQPYVRLNFDKHFIEKLTFEPPVIGEEQGVWRTTERIYRAQRGLDNAEGIPGTDTNNMGTAEYPWVDFDENSYYIENIERINWDLNEIKEAIEVAQGSIEDFGITVMINSVRMDEDGEIYEIDQYVDELTTATATALGIAPANVTVQYIPFEHIDDTMKQMKEMEEARLAREQRDRLVDQILMYGTILALAIMVILLVRSVVRTLRPPPEPELVLAAEGPPMAAIDMIIDETLVDQIEAEKARELEEIELNQEKSPALEQIERFIEKDAAAVAQLLRNWLDD